MRPASSYSDYLTFRGPATCVRSSENGGADPLPQGVKTFARDGAEPDGRVAAALSELFQLQLARGDADLVDLGRDEDDVERAPVARRARLPQELDELPLFLLDPAAHIDEE